MNLTGLTVLNTRPLEQGQKLTAAINAAGGQAIACPALTIEAVHTDWLARLPPLGTVQQALFISANAVKFFFAALQEHSIHWPEHIIITAIGQGTAHSLQAYQLSPSFIPDVADSEHVLLLPPLQQVQDQLILLIKGEAGRNVLANALCQRKAQLVEVNVYRRCQPYLNPQQLTELWQKQAIDIILFTSHQAMLNYFAMFETAAHPWLKNTPWLVISPRLAHEAALLGAKKILVSKPEHILETLYRFREGLINEHN